MGIKRFNKVLHAFFGTGSGFSVGGFADLAEYLWYIIRAITRESGASGQEAIIELLFFPKLITFFSNNNLSFS